VTNDKTVDDTVEVVLENTDFRLVKKSKHFYFYSRQTDAFDNIHWELETDDDYKWFNLCAMIDRTLKKDP